MEKLDLPPVTEYKGEDSEIYLVSHPGWNIYSYGFSKFFDRVSNDPKMSSEFKNDPYMRAIIRAESDALGAHQAIKEFELLFSNKNLKERIPVFLTVPFCNGELVEMGEGYSEYIHEISSDNTFYIETRSCDYRATGKISQNHLSRVRELVSGRKVYAFGSNLEECLKETIQDLSQESFNLILLLSHCKAVGILENFHYDGVSPDDFRKKIYEMFSSDNTRKRLSEIYREHYLDDIVASHPGFKLSSVFL